MWNSIRVYERATGALANGTKFEGLRFGSLKRDKYNEEFSPGVKPSLGVSSDGKVTLSLHVPKGYGIRWCQKGSYIISLGAPHGWDFSRVEYFESKYYQVKSLMSGWHDVERMSQHGSAMVANNMVYSRFLI